jgi:hypothetical protein
MRVWLSLLLLLVVVPLAFAQRSMMTVDVTNPINTANPQAKGLLRVWQVLPGRMGGTNWADLVAHAPAALISMAPTGSTTSGWGTTKRRGGFGELRFDGTDDYIDLGTSTFYDFPNTTFAVSGWCRATGAGYVIARRLGSGGNGGWFLRLNGDGTLTARIIDTGNTTAAERASLTTSALNGQWFHFLVVFVTDTATAATNDVTIYIDGRLSQGTRGTTSGLPYTLGAYALTLGATSDPAAFLTGALDDVRIYTRSLGAVHAQKMASDPWSSLVRRFPLPGAALAAAVKRSRGHLY